MARRPREALIAEDAQALRLWIEIEEKKAAAEAKRVADLERAKAEAQRLFLVQQEMLRLHTEEAARQRQREAEERRVKLEAARMVREGQQQAELARVVEEARKYSEQQRQAALEYIQRINVLRAMIEKGLL